ncbi:MAG TPA: DUF2071 domain-containing protein [Flavobacteriaceae bacterium]|nr:DUF2071 domain-containing protein [Flavobacteriaceae bacterium]
MSFLTAEWRKLAIANYVIDPDVLSTYIPFGTELDLWEGKYFVSLIGFMFKNTKLLGIKIPFHINFEEVNLRFYVRRFENGTWKRGVVFIKELVPKPAITFVANRLYKENYETAPMRHQWKKDDKIRKVAYHWKMNNRWHSLKITADLKSSEIPRNSITEFITEHYWGYARVDKNVTHEYEVTHPRWRHYNIKDAEVDVDFGAVYGKDFQFLNDIKPHSVMLAEGSKITIEDKKVIK